MHGRIGEHLLSKEMRILNHIVMLTDKDIPYEADPRHAELLVRNVAVSIFVATPGVKDSNLEDQAPKDQEDVGAVEGNCVEPPCGISCETKSAGGQQWAPAIYTHTTLTNDIKHTKCPIGLGRERSLSGANLTALLTGTDGTDLPDVEDTERMCASNTSEIWRILCEKDEPDDTFFCSSRPRRRL